MPGTIHPAPVCDKVDENGCVLSALLQATDQMLVYLDRDFNFVWVNNAYAETCKMQPGEMAGKNHFSLYPHAENEAIFRKVRDTGQPIFYKDKPFAFPDQPERGTTYWDWSLTPVKSGDDQVVGLVFSLRETTKQVRAEQALRESEARFRTLFEKAPVAIFVHDPDSGEVLEANRRAIESYGYSTLNELKQAPLFSDPPFSEQEAMQLIRKAVGEGPQRFEWRSMDRNGNAFWEDILLTPVLFDETPRVLAMATDITERKQAENALREADQRKDEFLAMLAHELRNPLTPISNAAHVLGRLALEDPRITWAHKVIDGQVNHLSRLVDDLLDVSRIVQGKINLKLETITLASIVEQLMTLARPLAEKKHQELIVRLPKENVLLEGDATRLSQVLFNLVDNATKFTPEHGRIELSALLSGEEIDITVQDNGMGIAAELLPRVFDLFQQDARTVERAAGGLGIGLTLVQRLVEMHGGRVTAHSAGDGQGAALTIHLPARVAPVQPVTGEAAITCQPASRKLRVLVVDDDHVVAESMVRVLELDDYDARVAHTGQSALEQIPDFRPQIVLLDIGLKGMDGFETAKRLGELLERRDFCLIAITGYGDEQTRARALASGCDHFMVKPVRFSVIRELLIKEAASRHWS